MPIKKRLTEPFALAPWYASDDAKRSFGRIAQEVNDTGKSTTLLGNKENPLLVLEDADDHPPTPEEIIITIDEARADWSAITTAAALSDARFRIKGKRVERAVLSRHPDATHPARKYLRSQSIDANALALRLEQLAKEVRALGQQLKRLGDLDFLTDRLDRSANVIDRRFKEIWRLANPEHLARA